MWFLPIVENGIEMTDDVSQDEETSSTCIAPRHHPETPPCASRQYPESTKGGSSQNTIKGSSLPQRLHTCRTERDSMVVKNACTGCNDLLLLGNREPVCQLGSQTGVR